MRLADSKPSKVAHRLGVHSEAVAKCMNNACANQVCRDCTVWASGLGYGPFMICVRCRPTYRRVGFTVTDEQDDPSG